MRQLHFVLASALTLVPALASAAAPPRAAAVQTGWYYSLAGRTEGPFDDAHFAEAYLSGVVTDTTSIWWDGAQGGWVALAQSQRFAEIDRWYLRRGSKQIGPMTAAEARAQIADARRSGKTIESLDVRLEH